MGRVPGPVPGLAARRMSLSSRSAVRKAASLAGADPLARMARIRDPDCSIVVLPRRPVPELATCLAGLDPLRIGRVRIEAALPELEPVLRDALAGASLAALRADALHCATLLARLSGAGALRLRLECVEDDACRRFHADNIELRLLCTYLGPGTEWLPDPAEPSAIRRVPPLAVAVLKGRAWRRGGSPCIHRSPPIAGSGVRRLLLAVDPLPAP